MLNRFLFRLWPLAALSLLLVGGGGCADKGDVPAFGPDPDVGPARPSAEEPFLSVEPDQLLFDASGNGCNGEYCIVKSNGSWYVELPEGCEWLDCSPLAGTGTDTLRFRLFLDESYHAAELQVVADGDDWPAPLVASLTIRQGIAPDEPDNPDNPDDPNDPEDPDPDDPENPDNPNDPDDPNHPGGDDPTTDPSNPDDPPVDPGPGEEEPEPQPGGGSDDFATLAPDSRYMDRVGPTETGWSAAYCAVYTGGGPYDSDPNYPSLLGADAGRRGLSMSGKSTAVGTILSPELSGGCGTLAFDYGITRTGDERVDLQVELLQEDAVVRSFRLQTTVEKLRACHFSAEVHLPGTFRIRFRNNSPSGEAKELDCCTIFNVSWTGEPTAGR